MNAQCRAREDDWRVNNFDLIRLLAALQVATAHAMTALQLHGANATFFNFGLRMFPGVPIFFVISGFLIAKSYERSGSVRDYYRNRCLRIFPALWICLVASVGVILFAGVAALNPISTPDWLGWWTAEMTLFQQYEPGFMRPVGIGWLDGSLWTIPIELEFYLLLPVLFAAFQLHKRRHDFALLALLTVSAAAHFVYSHHTIFPSIPSHSFLVETIVPYLWIFGIGVLMQRHWGILRGWLAGCTHWWLLGYALLCVVAKRLHVSVGSADISPIFLLPLAGLVLSAAVTLPTLSDRILRHNDISYGTYIYHALVLNVMLLLGIKGSVVSISAAVLISLTFGAGSWWLIERPFLQRKRNSLRATFRMRSPAEQMSVAAVESRSLA